MLHKKILTIVIAGAMFMALAGMAMAQASSTSSTKADENATAKKETATTKPVENMGMGNHQMMGTNTGMGNHEMMASKMGMESTNDEWSKIEAHYNEMMQMTDAAALKTELAKHQEMMASYRAKMMAQAELNHKNMSAQNQNMAKGENTKAMKDTKTKSTSH